MQKHENNTLAPDELNAFVQHVGEPDVITTPAYLFAVYADNELSHYQVRIADSKFNFATLPDVTAFAVRDSLRLTPGVPEVRSLSPDKRGLHGLSKEQWLELVQHWEAETGVKQNLAP